MKYYNYYSVYGDYNIYFKIKKYYYGNTALQAYLKNGEPFASFSVNFDFKFGDNTIAVDINNVEHADDMLEQYNIAEPTGLFIKSCFCEYPLMVLTERFIKECAEREE